MEDKHILLIDSSHFFFGEYPYKVVVDQPPKPRAPVSLMPRSGMWDEYTARCQAVRRQRSKFRSTVQPLLSEMVAWRLVNAPTALNFFFKRNDDMQRFVDAVPDSVREIHRPASPRHHAAMEGDRGVKVQKTLYWNKFRFKLVVRSEQDAITEWVATYVSNDPDRALLSLGWSEHVVYLDDERDVLLLKLAFTDNVKRIERVILHTELD